MWKEYLKENNEEKIIECCMGMDTQEVTDARQARKISNTFQKNNETEESVRWMERTVELESSPRFMSELMNLYLQTEATGEQWRFLLEKAEGKSKECAAVATYFYESAKGADTGKLAVLAKDMVDATGYNDVVYLEAAKHLDRSYYLKQIRVKTKDEKVHEKVSQMLDEDEGETKEVDIKSAISQRIARIVPNKIEELFSDVVGMENIKEEVGALYQHLQVNEGRIDQIAVPLNFVIAGQSGSGKTKLAYILAELLHEAGVAESAVPAEISALTLEESIEEVLNDTTPIIIINNAESLWNVSSETESSKSPQTGGQTWMFLEQLLEEACTERNRFFIFLGEVSCMDSLISCNAKLRNYVTYLKIPVYSGRELHQIGLQMIEQDEYEISKDGEEQFYQEIRKKSVLGDFANGHSIRQLIIEAKKNLAYRVASEGGSRSYEEQDFIIQNVEEETLEELLDKLNSMTGLKTVKEEVKGKIAVFKQNEANRKAGIEDEASFTLNTLLLGPPGTGKTTVARLLGKIYGQIGILPRGDIFVEATREDLVAGYSGQTAIKVDNLVKKAMGGVLFIDEAYNLVTGDHDEFGKEAFNALLTKAENYRDRLMIIMAGYEEQMRQLLAVNEGMARRFPHELHFEDYTEDELMQIFQFMLESRHYYLHMDAEQAVRRLIKSKMSRTNFGNAGEVRNILEGIIQKLSVRAFNQKIEQSVDRRTIRKIDVDDYIGHETTNEKTLDDYLDELNNLTGMESVKKHIMDEIKSSKIAQERARRAGVPYSPGSLHMLLVGNAGTGKTTVARLIGKIYGKAGLIKNEEVFVEIRRESLVAGYMGQTGAKVTKEVERAKGGVMFIDEAYNLVNGEHDEFGKDALNTLLAPIENNRDDLMVIMAGYEEEMEDLLNHNQGLRSRLNTKLILEDYSMEQMVDIFYKKAELEGYRIESGLRDDVANYIAMEKEKAYPDFGNARGVRNCFEKVVKRMNARLAANEEILLSEAQLQSLSDDEISMIRRIDLE